MLHMYLKWNYTPYLPDVKELRLKQQAWYMKSNEQSFT